MEAARQTRTVEETIERHFAASRAMDTEAWVANFAPDAVCHDPVGGPPVKGHAGLRDLFQNICSAFASLAISEDLVLVSGSSAAVKWDGHAVGHNGRETRFEGIDVFDFDDAGRIRALWGYWDPGSVMMRLR